MTSLAILFGAALITYLIGRWLYENYESILPTSLLTVYLLFEIVVSVAVLIIVVQEHIVFMLVMIVVWMPNAYMMSRILSDFISAKTVAGVFMPTMHGPAKNRLGKMRALLNDYNTADAMKICREAFEKNTESPDTLFEGAKIFMEKGYYKEANELYAHIMELFGKELTAWSEAAWQQVVIYEEYLNQPEQSTALLRQLVHKAPLTELGRRAGARLQREMLALNPTESDAFYKKRM